MVETKESSIPNNPLFDFKSLINSSNGHLISLLIYKGGRQLQGNYLKLNCSLCMSVCVVLHIIMLAFLFFIKKSNCTYYRIILGYIVTVMVIFFKIFFI